MQVKISEGVEELYQNFCKSNSLNEKYFFNESYVYHFSQNTTGVPIFASYERHEKGEDSVEFIEFQMNHKVILTGRKVNGEVSYHLKQYKSGVDLIFRETTIPCNDISNLTEFIKELI